MTRRLLHAVLSVPLAAAVIWRAAPPVHAADPEISKDVIAVQIRKQGFECKNPKSAERDPAAAAKPDEAAWILTCEGASYKVQLIPKQAAKVERIEESKEETKALEGAKTP